MTLLVLSFHGCGLSCVLISAGRSDQEKYWNYADDVDNDNDDGDSDGDGDKKASCDFLKYVWYALADFLC